MLYFYEYEKGSFEVPPGLTNGFVVRKRVPGSSIFLLQDKNNDFVLCSF